MSTVKDKVCVVTGVSSGIGLAVAGALIDAGASVFGIDMQECPQHAKASTAFRFYQCDLTDTNSLTAALRDCIEAFGPRIDALLNIAGIMDAYEGVESLPEATWDRVMAVNLTAPIMLMKQVVPIMQAQRYGGSIVNVASKAATSGAVSGIAYTASKHGLVGATKHVAWRYKDENIRCNAVSPGGR